MFEKLRKQLHIIALFSRHLKECSSFARSGNQKEMQITLK